MFESLQTPAVLVDADRLQRNISRTQSRAREQGVVLRPHVKTHRSVEIARRQLAAGAGGITCAKPSEAEVFVDAGIDDVRVAYPVFGQQRVERLLALAQRARVSFCLDSVDGADQVSAAFAQASATAGVLLKIDCGYGRAGWRWDENSLPDVARRIAALPALKILGVLTHAGQAYSPGAQSEDPRSVLRQHARDERDRTQEAAQMIAQSLGVDEFEVSVGSTPTFSQFESGSASVTVGSAEFPVTEVRPGNYVFHDLTQVELGAAGLDDCALTVLATVVSARERSGRLHALIDAGKKTFTSDQRAGQEGFGLILDGGPEADGSAPLRIMDDVRLHALSEEHGWVDAPLSSGLGIGDRVRVAVNHSCVVVSTQRTLHEVRGGEVVGRIEVSASGCST